MVTREIGAIQARSAEPECDIGACGARLDAIEAGLCDFLTAAGGATTTPIKFESLGVFHVLYTELLAARIHVTAASVKKHTPSSQSE